MKRILTGLKPTGDITLGNYIGAIKQMIKLQDSYESFLFVADLHALTIKQEPKELNRRIREFVAMYLACGINPDKNVIYIQSENEFIPCISYLLECNTYFGEASRMIQFKEKSKQNANFNISLFTYPVLMTADILFCDADFVPVGIDQKQHVELARNIAERFNKQYGKTFNIPEPLVSKDSIKIRDLKEPTKKMSKSEENPQGVISMFDKPEIIYKKIMKATTDSDSIIKFDMDNKPGISNLLNIATVISGDKINDIEKKFIGKGYGDFKKYVAEITSKHIEKIQKRFKEIINSKNIEIILNKGKEKSRELAKIKYEEMKNKIGITRKHIQNNN